VCDALEVGAKEEKHGPRARLLLRQLGPILGGARPSLTTITRERDASLVNVEGNEYRSTSQEKDLCRALLTHPLWVLAERLLHVLGQPAGRGAIPVGAQSPEAIVSVLRGFLPCEGLFVHPDIPGERRAAAVLSCELPLGESVLGLIDCTQLGSAKNALLFGIFGVYCHNGFPADVIGAGQVAYREFASMTFASPGRGRVKVGPGEHQWLDCKGSRCPAETIVAVLQAVRARLSSPP
jgi:hypothetical protein